MATQARDTAPHYQHSQIGYNYRLSNISAAIGRGQLRVIDQRVAQRRSNYDYYLKALGLMPEVSFLPEPEAMFSNRWLTTVLLESIDKQVVMREWVQQYLERDNIESRPLWKPMHLQPVFRHCPAYGGSVSQALFDSGLCLPSSSNLTTDHLNRVVGMLNEAIRNPR